MNLAADKYNRSGQHNGDWGTIDGTSEWIRDYCQGLEWLQLSCFVCKLPRMLEIGKLHVNEWYDANSGASDKDKRGRFARHIQNVLEQEARGGPGKRSQKNTQTFAWEIPRAFGWNCKPVFFEPE